jgi:hypothetical protein
VPRLNRLNTALAVTVHAFQDEISELSDVGGPPQHGWASPMLNRTKRGQREDMSPPACLLEPGDITLLLLD